MRLVIASDIHGSKKYLSMLLEREKEADRIFLLGDLYYHGVRNDLPEGYCPKEVVGILNDIKRKLIVVKGNCESDVDQMVSQFPIVEEVVMFLDGKSALLVHGHKLSFDNLPDYNIDIFIQGHTHVSKMVRRGNLLLLNPGSISIPKDGRHSYMVYENGLFSLIDLVTGEIIQKIEM